MIKLIASDLDGTLLHNRGNQVSEEMFELIYEMKKRGIMFAAASGRQYPNVRKLFAPVVEDMMFICENGAVVMYQDKVIFKNVLPWDTVRKMTDIVLAEPQVEIILSGVMNSYINPREKEYEDLIRRLGNEVSCVENLDQISDEIVKLAIYEKQGVEGRTTYWQKKMIPPARAVMSGDCWIDILYPNGDKGAGIKKIQEYMGIKKEETMAFGDNENDKDMMYMVGYPVAMENGVEPLKQICPYKTTNVEDTIKKVLLGVF